MYSAVWHKGTLSPPDCKELILFAYISIDYRLWPHVICSPIHPGSLCPWTLLMPLPIPLPLPSFPSLHGSHNDVSFQLCSVGDDCLAQGYQPAAARRIVLFCPWPHLLIVSFSSSISATARCGLWPVEQYLSIFPYPSPTLSIFSLPALEDFFLLST